jgi:hypothetical protein
MDIGDPVTKRLAGMMAIVTRSPMDRSAKAIAEVARRRTGVWWGQMAAPRSARSASSGRSMVSRSMVRRLAQSRGRGGAVVAPDDAHQAVLTVEATERRLGHLPRDKATIGDERAEDERHRRRAVLASDVEQEVAEFRQEVAAASTVTPRLRQERLQATGPVAVVQTLDGRDRGTPCGGGPWGTVGPLGQPSELRTEGACPPSISRRPRGASPQSPQRSSPKSGVNDAAEPS